MPAVKFFVRLDLDPIFLFLDGHESMKSDKIGPGAIKKSILA